MDELGTPRIGRTLFIPLKATFEGAIDFPGPVVIEGTILGDVDCMSLVVAERGSVDGTIKAEDVTILGSVSGEIFADQLTLKTACSVSADIYHKKLSLEEGCVFEGKSRRHASPLLLAAQ